MHLIDKCRLGKFGTSQNIRNENHGWLLHSFELAEDSDYSHISRSRDKYGIAGEKYCAREVSEEEMEDFGGNHSIALVTAVLISTKPASCSACCTNTLPATCCHPQKDVHSETSAVSPQSNTLWDVSQERIHWRTMPWTGVWKQPQDFFPYPSALNWYLFRAFLQSHPGLEKKSQWNHCFGVTFHFCLEQTTITLLFF